MEDFEAFWKAYPRKVGKLGAERAWRKLKPPITDVLAALAWQVYQQSWRDVQYIPYPATWLHAGRWQDEPPVIKTPVRPWCLHQPPCKGEQGHRRRLAIELGEIPA